MDNELDALEAELKRLKPAAPSLRLMTSLERDLKPATSIELWRLSWVALPVAAAVALFLLRPPADRPVTATDVATSTSGNSPTVRMFKPIAAQNVLLGESEEGVVTLADGSHARRIRQSYIDKIRWENPSTHASLTWTIPREEVSVVPVSYE